MFFETIYRWLITLFGSPLADQLSGYDSATETVQGANQFVPIGMITLAIALVSVLLYYFVVNHPRFNCWWAWLIVLVSTSIINLFVGFGWTAKYAGEANISDTFFVYLSDCWGFGFANFFVSAMWFILFSLIARVIISRLFSKVGLHWGCNCRFSPF